MLGLNEQENLCVTQEEWTDFCKYIYAKYKENPRFEDAIWKFYVSIQNISFDEFQTRFKQNDGSYNDAAIRGELEKLGNADNARWISLDAVEDEESPLEERIQDSHFENISPESQLEIKQLTDKTSEVISSNEKVFSQLLERIDNPKNQKLKYRLLVKCLGFKNYLLVQASKAPSDWTEEEVRKKFRERYHNNKPHFNYKYLFLRNYFDPTGFYEYCFHHFSEELEDGGHLERSQRLYTDYYQKSKFTQSPSRDIKQLINFLMEEVDSEELRNSLKSALSCCSIEKTLSNVEGEALNADYPHSAAINPLRTVDPCSKEYRLICNLMILSECGIFALAEELKDKATSFEVHRHSCQKCDDYYKRFKRALEYRMGRKADLDTPNSRPLYYPVHYADLATSKKTKQDDIFAYYQNEYRRIPSLLNKNFLLQAARNVGRKDELDKLENGKQKKASQERQLESIGRDYVLSVRCICGSKTDYNLNHLRTQLVRFGRLQEDGVKIATINVCGDANNSLSRELCYFEYDKEKRDWFLVAGKCNEEDPNKGKKGNRIYVLNKNTFEKVLQNEDIKSTDQKQSCKHLDTNNFATLETNKMALKDIVGIGIHPFTTGHPLYFNGKGFAGICHPILGVLPFGWYIEVHSRLQEKVQASLVNRTVGYEEYHSICVADNKTIVGK